MVEFIVMVMDNYDGRMKHNGIPVVRAELCSCLGPSGRCTQVSSGAGGQAEGRGGRAFPQEGRGEDKEDDEAEPASADSGRERAERPSPDSPQVIRILILRRRFWVGFRGVGVVDTRPG